MPPGCWSGGVLGVWVCVAAVLVGNGSPSEDRDWAGRDDPVFVDRVDLGVGDGATVLPVVAEVEDVFELLAGFDLARDFELGVVVPDEVWFVTVVGVADHSS